MISIKHLKKSYGNITPIVDINLEVNDGDVISIIGPSGTGKSTLLRCINGLEQITDGQVIVDGVDIFDKKTNINSIRKKIGMVFQSFNLFSHKTVIENVMMGQIDLLGLSKQEAFDESIKYLRQVGLGEKLYSYPQELSGGQKQRVAIARCLAMKPEVILFDEPTSALDPTMVSEVEAVIKKLANKGLTMLIVSHDMKFSKDVANRVIYLDEGIVYEDSTPDQIFNNPQREKTKAFVKRLSTLSYNIHSKDFDIYELNAQINDFGRIYELSKKQINNLQIIIEELILNNMIKIVQDIKIKICYFEVDNKLQVILDYGADEYNPFDSNEEDILSMLIVRQLTSNVSYIRNDRNLISLELK